MRKSSWILLTTCIVACSLAQAGDFFVKHKGDKRRGEPTSDTALVYVFRPATMGAAVKTWTFVDDELIGVTRSKGYAFAHIAPGARTVWAKAENTSGLEVDLQAGETYYFKTSIRMGLGKARVKLEQVGEDDVAKLFDKCSYTEPTDEGRARAGEIAANRHERGKASAERRRN